MACGRGGQGGPARLGTWAPEMIRRPGAQMADELRWSMNVGTGPPVRGLCDQLAMIGVINELVPWDPQRCKLSPGGLIVADAAARSC